VAEGMLTSATRSRIAKLGETSRSQFGLGSGPTATTSGLIAATGGAAGSTLSILSPILLGSTAGPIGAAIGAGIVAVTQVLGVFGVGNGCGQSCVVASQNANDIENQMKQNLAAFQSGQIDRATALSNFDILWNAFVQMCHQVGGDQQTNCIADRQAGACKWHDSAGQCWNWDTGYRAPIQNAAAAAPTVAVSSLLKNITLPELLVLGVIGFGIAEAAS